MAVAGRFRINRQHVWSTVYPFMPEL